MKQKIWGLLMKTLVALIAGLFVFNAVAAEYSTHTYKTVGDRQLALHIVQPDGHTSSDRVPAVVFFHGGGWRGGSPESAFPYAEVLSENGIVTLAVEYRLNNTATLDEMIRDANAAVSWTRERARRLGVHPGRIIAVGHSAGGHLAAATATLNGFDEADSYTGTSSKPNALALMAPYAATQETVSEFLPPGADVTNYEPRLNITRRVPPTLIIQGDLDTVVLPEESAAYHETLVAAGVDAELFVLEGVGHGFRENDDRAAVSERLVRFAKDLGYLD